MEFINSLLMQIIARPAGQNLIVKLNFLLEEKNAKINFSQSGEFGCANVRGGNAKPDNESKLETSGLDYKSIIKRSISKSEGSNSVTVNVDTNYLNSTASIELEAYASPGKGLTDIGPAFILLAHELIHATHNLKGSSRDNVQNFFNSVNTNNDIPMSLLYPMEKKFNSFGAEAEEYWTIEGAKLCENALRKENGLSLRTGHLSTELGEGDRDLYHLGLARNNNEGTDGIMHFVEYCLKMQDLTPAEIEKIETESKYIWNAMKLEKLYSTKFTPDKLIENILAFTPITIKRAKAALLKEKNLMSANVDQKETFRIFLTSLPAFLQELFISIHVANTLKSNGNTVLQRNEFQEAIQRKMSSGAIKSISDVTEKINLLKSLYSDFTNHEPPDNFLENFLHVTRPSSQIQGTDGRSHSSTQQVLSNLHTAGNVSYETMHNHSSLTENKRVEKIPSAKTQPTVKSAKNQEKTSDEGKHVPHTK